MNSELAGKIVLVTGASGGIGGAIARKFAMEGAKLVLHCRSGTSRAKALQNELGCTDALIVRADLRKEDHVKRMFAQAIQRFGRIDTLVANAGSWEARETNFHRMPLAQWRDTLDSVLTTAFLSVREFFRLVATQKQGNAVVMGSTAAVFGEAGHADYAAAKSALAYGLTRTLKNELARLAPHTADYCGGRINCVCPGWTVVPRTAVKLQNAAVVKRVAATMSLPQIARPDDIANAVVFLSSDSLARHITGQTIVIAGGMEGRLLWESAEINAAIV